MLIIISSGMKSFVIVCGSFIFSFFFFFKFYSVLTLKSTNTSERVKYMTSLPPAHFKKAFMLQTVVLQHHFTVDQNVYGLLTKDIRSGDLKNRDIDM